MFLRRLPSGARLHCSSIIVYMRYDLEVVGEPYDRRHKCEDRGLR